LIAIHHCSIITVQPAAATSRRRGAAAAAARAEEEAAAREAWRGYLLRNKSIVVDLFQGQLRSSLQCRVCKHTSITFDPFMYLSVPMPRKQQQQPEPAADGSSTASTSSSSTASISSSSSSAEEQQPPTLERCIELFCEAEQLEGENSWHCPRCAKAVPATKKLDLWKMPPVLIIHLKRFDSGSGSGTSNLRGARSKLNDMLAFPLEGLDLTRFVRSPQREPPDYDLFAVANHHGSLWGGHYTAYCRNRVTNGWSQFDDADVRPVQPAKVQSSAAYVLFYSRMTTVQVR
jgi:ubiquitin C-terminal hydrolase